jgi:hypothetical protein
MLQNIEQAGAVLFGSNCTRVEHFAEEHHYNLVDAEISECEETNACVM